MDLKTLEELDQCEFCNGRGFKPGTGNGKDIPPTMCDACQSTGMEHFPELSFEELRMLYGLSSGVVQHAYRGVEKGVDTGVKLYSLTIEALADRHGDLIRKVAKYHAAQGTIAAARLTAPDNKVLMDFMNKITTVMS